MTAVAMVETAFGFRVDPSRLNRWLTSHGGYLDGDLLLWRQAAAATAGTVRWKWQHVPGMVRQLQVDDQDINPLPSQNVVRSDLDQGDLVVAEVRLLGSMHFVVLTGHSGNTFFINDPWFDERSTLGSRYGSYAQAVHSVEVYYRAG
jgi:hypothetical protein